MTDEFPMIHFLMFTCNAIVTELGHFAIEKAESQPYKLEYRKERAASALYI